MHISHLAFYAVTQDRVKVEPLLRPRECHTGLVDQIDQCTYIHVVVSSHRYTATMASQDVTKIKIDLVKINLDVIADWLVPRLETLVPDDDIVVGYAIELLKGGVPLEYKTIKSQLQGFLGKQTTPLCRQLWELLVSAQDDPHGIPKQLIEDKKRELRQMRENRNQRTTSNQTRDYSKYTTQGYGRRDHRDREKSPYRRERSTPDRSQHRRSRSPRHR